jgi:hypothetical protein
LRSVLPINVMTEPLILDRNNVPDEVIYYIYLIRGVAGKQNYLPIMDFDEMRIRTRDFVEVG